MAVHIDQTVERLTRHFYHVGHTRFIVAEALCSALEANGTRCCIAPRDISPSSEWAEEIIDGQALRYGTTAK